ncbi:MAG: hypothetical protein ACRERC_24055 [Candidatus Binatia bacterium]
MPLSTAFAWSLRNPGRVLLLAALLLVPRAASAQCVGDCTGDGRVSISDLILGVNIALGSQPVTACEAFANQSGRVTITQLISGVNNALGGCPATATPTDTASTPLASTPTSTSTATSTGTPVVPSATATATPQSTATHTLQPTSSATATATTLLPPVTPTSSATPTEVAATATSTASATPSQPAATATATSSATPSLEPTGTPTITSTAAPTPTATLAGPPPGDAIAGRAAIVATGLGSMPAVVGAVVTAVTGSGGGASVQNADGTTAGLDVDACPISGTTSQLCSEMGSGGSKTIHLELGATSCIANGPAGGTAEFDGTIVLDSTPFFLNSCSPVFLGAAFDTSDLSVRFRNAQADLLLSVGADLGGSFTLAPGGSCLVTSLNFTLNGSLVSALPDGSGIGVTFQNTTMLMNMITFNADCVPVAYKLTFNGNATFQPMAEALLEASASLQGLVEGGDQFAVTFANFILEQNANVNPVQSKMSGNMTSTCFGGTVALQTLVPVAVASGQLCPSSGQVTASRGGVTNDVLYSNGMVTINGATTYPSCLDPDLLSCSN